MSSSRAPAQFDETFFVAKKLKVPYRYVAVLGRVGRRLLYNVDAVEARNPHVLALLAG